MRPLIYLLLFLTAAGSAAAQTSSNAAAVLARMDTFRQDIYTTPRLEDREAIAMLKMDYAHPVILDPKQARLIRDSGYIIRSVDLVYTGDASADFMSRLNGRRLLALEAQLPGIFGQKNIRWRIVKQTGFRNHGEAVGMFHGFSVVYARIRRRVPATVERFREEVLRIAEKPVDSTIFKVFARNPQWSQDLIVVDMTSSMSPYYKELVAWLYLRKPKTGTAFSLFNDGDGIEDSKKKTGSTGGVYTFSSASLDTIIKRMLQVSRAGNGGDVQENDIEAILKGIKANPKVKEVILIADNYANMRDYILIPLVPRPVRVIVCGSAKGAVNTEYLNLARTTGGSVHTIEEDLKDLSKYKEADQFTIRGVKYRIREGRVERKP